jgi:hypothetical protein
MVLVDLDCVGSRDGLLSYPDFYLQILFLWEADTSLNKS